MKLVNLANTSTCSGKCWFGHCESQPVPKYGLYFWQTCEFAISFSIDSETLKTFTTQSHKQNLHHPPTLPLKLEFFVFCFFIVFCLISHLFLFLDLSHECLYMICYTILICLLFLFVLFVTREIYRFLELFFSYFQKWSR